MKRLQNPWEGLEGYYCFGCCPTNEGGLRMEFYEDDEDIVSVWNPGDHFQGWVNTLHGGIQAALIDEIAEWVVNRKLQTTGVTANLEVRYKMPVMMTGKPITLRAHLLETRRHLAYIEVSLYNDEGVLCSVGKLTYAFITPEKAAEEWHFHGCKAEGE